MKKLQFAVVRNCGSGVTRPKHKARYRAAEHGFNKTTAAFVCRCIHRRPIIQVVLLVFATFSSTLSLADEAANSEAIRVEIEHLRETGRLSIGEIDIAAGNALAEFYERRNFTPAWSDRDQVGELLQMVLTSRDDGLNPDDYHAQALERASVALEEGTEPTPRQLAAIELLFSDSLLRLAYHQLYGRVDPTSLDPLWNFKARQTLGADPLQTCRRRSTRRRLAICGNACMPVVPCTSACASLSENHRRIQSTAAGRVFLQEPR